MSYLPSDRGISGVIQVGASNAWVADSSIVRADLGWTRNVVVKDNVTVCAFALNNRPTFGLNIRVCDGVTARELPLSGVNNITGQYAINFVGNELVTLVGDPNYNPPIRVFRHSLLGVLLESRAYGTRSQPSGYPTDTNMVDATVMADGGWVGFYQVNYGEGSGIWCIYRDASGNWFNTKTPLFFGTKCNYVEAHWPSGLIAITGMNDGELWKGAWVSLSPVDGVVTVENGIPPLLATWGEWDPEGSIHTPEGFAIAGPNREPYENPLKGPYPPPGVTNGEGTQWATRVRVGNVDATRAETDWLTRNYTQRTNYCPLTRNPKTGKLHVAYALFDGGVFGGVVTESEALQEKLVAGNGLWIEAGDRRMHCEIACTPDRIEVFNLNAAGGMTVYTRPNV